LQNAEAQKRFEAQKGTQITNKYGKKVDITFDDVLAQTRKDNSVISQDAMAKAQGIPESAYRAPKKVSAPASPVYQKELTGQKGFAVKDEAGAERWFSNETAAQRYAGTVQQKPFSEPQQRMMQATFPATNDTSISGGGENIRSKIGEQVDLNRFRDEETGEINWEAAF